MIEVVDYGAGNLRSVVKAFESIGAPVRLCREPARISCADGVVFPGQGAFGTAAQLLEDKGFTAPLKDYLAADRPFLGICLGLQLLFETSAEAPGAKGLGVIPGTNRRFSPGKKVPHMGWNSVSWKRRSPVLDGLPESSFYYFVHSFYAVPEDPDWLAGETDYEEQFCAVVSRGNLTAVQFHPEKSQRLGLQLLSNFVSTCGNGEPTQP